MSRFADIKVEWRVADIERSLLQKVDKYEVSSIVGNVDRMEHSLREARAEIAELRFQLERQAYEMQRLTDTCNELSEKLSKQEVK